MNNYNARKMKEKQYKTFERSINQSILKKIQKTSNELFHDKLQDRLLVIRKNSSNEGDDFRGQSEKKPKTVSDISQMNSENLTNTIMEYTNKSLFSKPNVNTILPKISTDKSPDYQRLDVN